MKRENHKIGLFVAMYLARVAEINNAVRAIVRCYQALKHRGEKPTLTKIGQETGLVVINHIRTGIYGIEELAPFIV